ncbi:MAG: DUF2065 domain-containing protein [Thalassovita sp.]
MATLILALGLVLIVEGLAYALAPLLVERVLEALREIPLSQRRAIGLGALAIGVMLGWGVKTWSA